MIPPARRDDDIRGFFAAVGWIISRSYESYRTAAFYKEKPIVAGSKRFLLLILQSFSALFALMGFAFVSSENYFVYPLLFFVLFIACELLFRRFQLSVLAEFDERIMHRTFDDDKLLMHTKSASSTISRKTIFYFRRLS
jgi:hypothetical protein